jgi:replicative DNA helicase
MKSDKITERAVLAGICKYGRTGINEVADLITEDSFFDDSNRVIFRCITEILENSTKVDIPSILSVAHKFNCHEFLSQDTEVAYLRSIFSFNVEMESVRALSKKVRKLQIIREAHKKLQDANDALQELTGDEDIGEILTAIEAPIYEFSTGLELTDTQPELLFDEAEEYLQYLQENPSERVGLSTGYPYLDESIGGGLRRKSVTLFAARPGVIKSLCAKCVAVHNAKLSIPVLLLDTEMSKEDQLHRSIAGESSVSIREIETGKFGTDVAYTHQVFKAAQEMKDVPLYYKSIAGKSFEEIKSIIRRWLLTCVGYEDDVLNDCLVIYDYFKLMSSEILDEMSEFQALGFQIGKLHDLTVKYDFPVLSYVQLNRDGITKEDSSAISQSDRLEWLATSVGMFKIKTETEVNEDGRGGGDVKFLPIKGRHGMNIAQGDYICFQRDGHIGQLHELGTKFNFLQQQKENAEGFTGYNGNTGVADESNFEF